MSGIDPVLPIQTLQIKKNTDTIFPLELMRLIFSNLDGAHFRAAGLVCHAWYWISTEEAYSSMKVLIKYVFNALDIKKYSLERRALQHIGREMRDIKEMRNQFIDILAQVSPTDREAIPLSENDHFTELRKVLAASKRIVKAVFWPMPQFCRKLTNQREVDFLSEETGASFRLGDELIWVAYGDFHEEYMKIFAPVYGEAPRLIPAHLLIKKVDGDSIDLKLKNGTTLRLTCGKENDQAESFKTVIAQRNEKVNESDEELSSGLKLVARTIYVPNN